MLPLTAQKYCWMIWLLGDDDKSIMKALSDLWSCLIKQHFHVLTHRTILPYQTAYKKWALRLCNNLYFSVCLTKGYELPGGAPLSAPWLGSEKRSGEDSATCQDHWLRFGKAPQRRWERVPRRWWKGWLEIKDVTDSRAHSSGTNKDKIHLKESFSALQLKFIF